MRLCRLVLLLRLWLRLLLLDGRRQRHIVGQACTASCQAQVQPLGPLRLSMLLRLCLLLLNGVH